MDPTFHEIFREQVEFYRAAQVWAYYFPPPQGPSPRLLAIVSEAIEVGVADLGAKHALRADARLFLIVNLHQMVMLPLGHPNSPQELNAEVERGIKNDAKLIL